MKNLDAYRALRARIDTLIDEQRALPYLDDVTETDLYKKIVNAGVDINREMDGIVAECEEAGKDLPEPLFESYKGYFDDLSEVLDKSRAVSESLSKTVKPNILTDFISDSASSK